MNGSSIVVTGRARMLATRLHAMLRERDMASEVDRVACELLADALVRMRDAARILRREGAVVRVRTRSGGEAVWPRPAYRFLCVERAAALSLLRQLAMTPKTRGELRRLGPDGTVVDLDSVLGFGGGS